MYSDKLSSVKQTIRGKSLDACKARLYAMYGTEYQIVDLHTDLTPGILGGLLFQKDIVTVEYIVNNKRFNSNLTDPRPNPVPVYPSKTPVTPRSVPVSNPMLSNTSDDFVKSRDALLQKATPSITSNIQLGQIANKIEEMSKEIASIKQAGTENKDHPTIKKIEELLQLNEFTPKYIRKITDNIRNTFSLDEIDDYDKVQAKVVDWIGESIKVDDIGDQRPPRVIIIVGPTGVGKTSTIAKLAAIEKIKAKKLKMNEPVIKLITIDSMRVAAVEQLEHWGELLDISVDKAESADDMKNLVKHYKDGGKSLDYLLIDTSGYSPNDYENIGKMRTVLDVPGLKADIYLAIAASTKARDLENILRNYEPFNFKSVIITKLDETSSYGNVLSVLAERNKGIAWVTDGQYVLHHIQRATPVRFLRYLEGFKSDKEHLEHLFGKEDIE